MTLLLWSLAWVGWSCLMHRAGRLYERTSKPIGPELKPLRTFAVYSSERPAVRDGRLLYVSTDSNAVDALILASGGRLS